MLPLKSFFQRSLRQVVIPIQTRAQRYVGVKDRRLRCQTVQGKLASGRVSRKDTESIRTISLLHLRDELGREKALEVACAASANPVNGPIRLCEIPDAHGTINPHDDHLRDLAIRCQIIHGGSSVHELFPAIEEVKYRVTSILGPSVTRRQIHAVGAVFIKDGRMDTLRLADDNGLVSSGAARHCSECEER